MNFTLLPHHWVNAAVVFVQQRAVAEANREASYARQQAMLAKERRFVERFATHVAKAAQVQSRVKKLDKIEELELDDGGSQPSLGTPETFDFDG